MSARTILKHLHQQGRMTDYQFDVINRNLKERPQGEWIDGTQGWYCSVCGEIDYSHSDHIYCGCCGAEMREEKKNE